MNIGSSKCDVNFETERHFIELWKVSIQNRRGCVSEKINSLKKFPGPATNEELKHFFDLDNYIGKFSPYLATKTNRLRNLTKNGIQFARDTEWEKAFQE